MPPRARRTRRLAQAQTRIGLAARGEAGARLTDHLGMQTSPDTILRLVRRLPLPSADRPRAVGIDDWAIRKARFYGTLLVDLDRRCPIDLLPDRTGATVTDWLRRHPGIQIVTRDRSTEYARAAAAGAPAALQVADRWHLLLNMRQALERWLGRVHGRLRQLPALPSGDRRQPGERLRAYRRSAAELTMSRDSRARRLAAYEDVRRRYLAGQTLLAIGRATGLARATVRNPVLAAAMGIKVGPTRATLFAIGAGLTALAGAILAPLNTLDPQYGLLFLVNAFLVVILGGQGSLRGLVIAAVILGGSLSVMQFTISSVIAQIVVIVIAVVAVRLRPVLVRALAERRERRATAAAGA